jgi:HEAT repeat protein
MVANQEIPFNTIIDALLDIDTPFHPRYLYRLTDLDPVELAQFKEAWTQLPVWRRRALLEDLEELGSADNLLSYETIGRHAVADEDALVRQLAVRILWEFDAGDLVPIFLDLLEKDADDNVRAAAATALGRYVYLGEIEELSEEKLRMVEDRLLSALREDEAALVRRRALESVSYSSRPEVPALIEAALSSGDREWMASSLLAMGRSADERWEGTVLEMLDNKIPALRAEAARAAGELEISDAIPQLIDLIEDSSDEVRSAAIWSLSQIGGEGVRAALEDLLARSEADAEADFLETALDNLAFTEGLQPFSFLDYPEGDIESSMQDLLEEDEEDLLDFEDEEVGDFSDIDDDDEEYEDLLD